MLNAASTDSVVYSSLSYEKTCSRSNLFLAGNLLLITFLMTSVYFINWKTNYALQKPKKHEAKNAMDLV